MKNILLTEADYRDKYPPLGLMKISTFHKLNGDNVEYSREKQKKEKNYYSKIYIATRFSFHWKKTKELIKYYENNYDAQILVGGIHASINPELYEKEFQLKVHVGSLKGDIENILQLIEKDPILNNILEDVRSYGIDALPPDYSLFEGQDLPFSKVLEENYLLRATKGCNRNCSFCDVRKIHNSYNSKLPISPIVNYIKKNYGEKRNILFFDDNTLLSKKLDEIVIELSSLGFNQGAKFGKKRRYCDFNQGLDLRLLDENKINLLNTISINPVRFAFDDISLKELFKDRIEKVVNSGIKNIAVYVLYNYNDTPEDFYQRLKISIDINKKHNCRIFSFPMKYVPNEQIDRKYIGGNWTKRMIRGVQCILNSTHGIVPVNPDFFNVAFGENENAFLNILHLPENYIIYRKENKDNIGKWSEEYRQFNTEEKVLIHQAISAGKRKIDVNNILDPKLLRFLEHYINE
ncbi:radical SAM superfamily enzyme YgiQ (UPF0313 family) [Dysgonomonas alginatilytica]|uniref:Radical SAM superfamily enzyme YgiQ (UPF0313 family) n=1 Tax=Dysgonomonas alginatilytica TaxID=1605892 RepID=A0A2V3PJP1_9BACT|nr:radical SAM protein [Dysgonomonas alginatilytica]PXV58806.1 radical SAM superfamily enzyme YgiQ (UPF0313 family) [Dysgonomonas alginatilytica]